jgi:processive 1,2-diacylglycerol beta-glucosyltransferase
MRSQSEPRIIFCSASVGSGHTRAAQAVQSFFKNSELIDVLDFTPRWFTKIYRDGYFFAVKHFPRLVGYCYENSDIPHEERGFMERITSLCEDMIAYRFRNHVLNQDADAIVSTHFFTSGVLGRMRRRGELNVPVITVVTDDYPHSIWLEPGVDLICVANDNAAAEAVENGADPSIIHATGIPIDPKFNMRRRLGSKKKPIVLVSGGGSGIGEIEDTVRHLLRMSDTVKTIVVCGSNEKLEQSLKRLECKDLEVLGFTDKMHELMQQADILVCKPGGLTTTEAIASGLPMILMNPIPGQEERNAEMLIGSDAAVVGFNPEDIYRIVNYLLLDKNYKRLTRMKAAAVSLWIPQSAKNVANQVKSLIL